MTQQKKIEILDRQIEKLFEQNFSRSTWIVETGNLFNHIFEDADNKRDQLGQMLKQPGSELLGINEDKVKSDWKTLLEGYKFELELASDSSSEKRKELDTSKVFIVHGHDDEAKERVARFIAKMGFEPIILHEQVSSSKTIIEKIEEYSGVGFAIILYTPCDLGKANSNVATLAFRARQNVVFEHGFFIGKIGRANALALVKGDIETPNDISGVVYTKLDDDNAWHLKLAKELRASGYSVDLNRL